MEKKFAYAIWPWGTANREQYISALADISEVGYKYCESVHNSIDVFLNDVAGFKAINAEYGVTPVSFYFHLSGDDEKDIANLRQKAAFLEACGISRVSLQAQGSPEPASPELLEKTLKTVNTFAKICAGIGVVPCVHPHHGTAIMYENEIDFILQNTDPELVSFGPDTAHLVAGRCNPAAIFERYKNRINFTHMKDISGAEAISKGYETGVQVYSNFRELGRGDIDFKSVFNVLKSVGYSGYITAELDKTLSTNKESARISLEFLKANY